MLAAMTTARMAATAYTISLVDWECWFHHPLILDKASGMEYSSSCSAHFPQDAKLTTEVVTNLQ
jgi:hypothetical protein